MICDALIFQYLEFSHGLTIYRAASLGTNNFTLRCGDAFDKQPQREHDLEYERRQPLIVSGQRPGGETGAAAAVAPRAGPTRTPPSRRLRRAPFVRGGGARK